MALLPVAIALYLLREPLIGYYSQAIHWVYAQQKIFHGQMTGSLSSLADTSAFSAGVTLVVGSFLYGIFHAAGPGHGKVILSTYLATNPERIGRSVAMALASALMQGVVAVFLVYGLFYIFDLVPRESKAAVLWSERISYLLVIGLGFWLFWRGARPLWRSLQNNGHDHHHVHHSHHDHDEHHHHDGHHHHHAPGEVCSSCGHTHMPTDEQVAKASDWRSVLGVVVSIGLRPCSGAVLVLIFARFAGIPLAGVASVFAISLGTAITVAAIALLDLQVRNFAERLAGSSSRGLEIAPHLFSCAGGIVLCLFGYGLLSGTFVSGVRSMGLG